MAFDVWREVWEHRPEDLTSTELLVLLAVADSAGEDDRMTKLSNKSIAKKTSLAERTVIKSLESLYSRGILQNVAEEAIPPKYRRYKSKTRRVTEVEHWSKGVPVPDYVKPPRTASGAVPEDDSELSSAPDAPNPLYNPSGYRRNTSYSSAMTRSWRREPSKAELRRRAQEAEDALDPDKLLREDSEPRNSGSEYEEPRRWRTPNPDSGMGLAAYFIAAIQRVGGWDSVAPINQQALAVNINRWKKSGATPQQIRRMIDLYAKKPGLRKKGVSPWVDFVSKRFMLIEKVRRQPASLYEEIDWDDPEAFKSEVPQSDDIDDSDGYEIDRSIWG